MNLDHDFTSLDAGVSHRSQEGSFVFSNSPEAWTPCSAQEDFLITLLTFVLAMVAPVAFFAWLVS